MLKNIKNKDEEGKEKSEIEKEILLENEYINQEIAEAEDKYQRKIKTNIDWANLSDRQIKVGLELKNIGQLFFQKETNGLSLITVTKCIITRDLKKVDFYITVLPEERERQALEFAKRLRTDLRTEIKHKLRIRTIPQVEVKIDVGEKARQRMDLILRKNKINNI